ncbi:MAG: sigma 54-interacting transcriptional regulator [candidate division KSB1 bacterium]|nr:sigma 54-interacting transcriptional regulator [candidate division KSB1 bacterium]
MIFKVFKITNDDLKIPGAFEKLTNEQLAQIHGKIQAGEWMILILPVETLLFFYSDSNRPQNHLAQALNQAGLLAGKKCDYQEAAGAEALELFLQLATGISQGQAEPRLIQYLREVYIQAGECGNIGPVFHRLFQRGIWLHEKARMETDFFRFSIHPHEAFAELAQKIFGDLGNVHVQMIEAPAQGLHDWLDALYHKGCRKFTLLTHEPNRIMPAKYATQVLSIERNPILSSNVDILLIFDEQAVTLERRAITRRMSSRQNFPLLIFDATGRVTDANGIDRIYNVFVYQVHDLQRIAQKNREEQAEVGEKITRWIREEAATIREWLYSDSRHQFAGIIGATPEMQRIFELISRIAQTNITVLIQGESGTGKELVARAIHQLSKRANKPFITVNCGAIPENLLESELFGHVKGAFTGAINHKRGLFEEAQEGTIFLDEIAELPHQLQVKLLRCLQEGEVKRVGSNEVIKVDVRVIAATNQELLKMVEEGRFRSDLYYRLNVIQINLPRLRNRQEDIPILAQHFVKKYAARLQKAVDEISAEALQALYAYPWPGNVRELENAIEHAVAMAIGPSIELHDLPIHLQQARTSEPCDNHRASRMTLKEMEKHYIRETLEDCGWNYEMASRILGIGRTTLWRKLREYQIQKPEKV